MSDEIPKNIKNILTDDEEIEETFTLKDCEVYATNKRLIERRKRRIRDFDYNHISSITFESNRSWRLILLSVLIVVVGIWIRDLTNDILSWVVIIIGLAFAIWAIFRRPEWVAITVVGLLKPIPYHGDRDDLDSLLYLVRQNKVSVAASQQKENVENRAVNLIKQLAELRDKGVLTQEEFEQKKGQVLRDMD
jgi:hypothetical protein